MATIMTDAAYMGFPLSIKRGNPAPVDTTAVWYNKTELETYAASGATAYVGQILTYVNETASTCEAYMISNEAGTLIKLASTTASGDLAGDVATLQGQVADLIAKVGKAAEGEIAATGLYKEIADVLAVAEGKVKSVKATDKSVIVGGSATEPTVKVAISGDEGNALSLAADGLKVTIPEVTVPEYSVKKLDTATAGMSASYQLTKDGTGIGAVINIPKDMVVSSGVVETKDAAGVWGVAGTYLVLTLANATSDKVYINVSDLIEYVTGAAAADGIITTSVDANHVLTATIGDGKITKAKLVKAVQDSLALADSALQEADLEPYAKTADVASGYVAKETGKRLMTDAEGTKLAGIATGAQVNVLEKVKVGGTELTITDKAVDITEVSTDLLKQGTQTLVLKGGNAATLAQG